jgi:site-specific recombinase XerD
MLGFMEAPLNHFFNERSDPRTLDVLTGSPLAAHLKAYAQQLHDQGYSVSSGRSQLRVLVHFNRWLHSKGLAAEQIDSSMLERYVHCRRKSRKLHKGDIAALGRLWRMLRPSEFETPSTPPSACQIVLHQFQHYLRQERGLTEGTITSYTPFVRAFLVECFPTEIPDFRQLCANAIADFVQRRAQGTSTKHATNAAIALRSFLRHLLHRGAIDTDLAACVPTIATWPLSNVPKFLPIDQIRRVLNSCNRNTAIGKRNYAILMLLARLGLRAGEVVALTLEDLDWEAGLITVRAKCRRITQMPLPVEVGVAIADYLCQARPRCSCRRVFIRDKAPLVGFATSVAICSLVDRALERAGIESAYRGSHLFRHSLATQMLKQGASLPEIGDLLRHRRPDTTAIYAKVDQVSLRAIALPWPGGGR